MSEAQSQKGQRAAVPPGAIQAETPRRSGPDAQAVTGPVLTQRVCTSQEIPDSASDLVPFLKSKGLETVDKRPQGGALWVVGGREELASLMAELAKKGHRFVFTANGGRASKHRPSWYMRG